MFFFQVIIVVKIWSQCIGDNTLHFYVFAFNMHQQCLSLGKALEEDH